MNYNNSGYLSSISSGGAVRYTISAMNARQQVTTATYGSNLSAVNGFDAYGYPSSTTTGTLREYRYTFDPVTGNLTSRQNFKRNLSESFSYDNLDRLTGVAGPQNLSMTYGNNGNLSTKSDIGTTEFSYGEDASPYAITGVSSSTGTIPAAAQQVIYTSSEKVSQITQGAFTASFLYDSDMQRARMTTAQSGNTILSRWYVGYDYIKEVAGGITKEYTYIGGGAYSAPVMAVTQNATTSYFYLLRDHLGSVTHVVRSDNTLEAEYSYDAWGRRRSADDWSYTLDVNDKALFAGRGFTGHEHLQWFDLVNMNGRLYDPLIARFLSPDNFVQAPGFSQGFNRYSYCLNNPLIYTDPDGEFPWLAAGIFAIFTYFKTAHDNRDQETDKWAWNPLDWFKEGSNTTIVVGVSTNSSFSNFTVYAGIGSDFTIPAISYNNEHGLGVGNANNPGFNEFFYPSINYYASEENAIRNINGIKQRWDGIYFVGEENDAIQMLLLDSRFFNVETSLWSTSRGFYFEPIRGIVIALLMMRYQGKP